VPQRLAAGAITFEPRFAEHTMSGQNENIRVDLAPEPKARVKADSDASSIELTVHELEARIAPRLAANHNETLLIDAE
jgi:hypothetical protein